MRMLHVAKSVVALVAACCALAHPAAAQDAAGSSDHPLVGRFQGSIIIGYKQSALDEAALLQAPHDYNALLERNALADRGGPEWLAVEGEVTRIRYEMPPGHSSLEVIRAYRAALEAQGFSIVFSCAGSQCLTGTLTDDYLLGQQLDTDNSDTMRYGSGTRYLLARLGGPTTPDMGMDAPMQDFEADFADSAAPDDLDAALSDPDLIEEPGSDMGGPGSDMGGPGSEMAGGPGSEIGAAPGSGGPGTEMGGQGSDIAAPMMAPEPATPGPVEASYVAILVGEDQALTTAFVEVVEPPAGGAAVLGNIDVVDSAQMADALGASGSIDLYGLNFDYDSATLRPESGATLAQIAKLLQSQPGLRLSVIGHTDNQGSATYNQQLSQARARSVVAALVRDYGIEEGRLTPAGRGLDQPLATNDTDEGRALNRRVELLAQP